jgi:hypothetical protein
MRLTLLSILTAVARCLGLLSLRLTGTAAGALDETFGVSAFAAGDTFGYRHPAGFVH